MHLFFRNNRSGTYPWLAVPREINSATMVLLTAAAIVFSAEMIMGYSVVDEIVLYVLLSVMLFTRREDPGSTLRTVPASPLFKLHRVVSMLFAAYCCFQVVRGAMVLDDLREIRFLLMFGSIWVIAALRVEDSIEPARAARVIVLSTAVYLALYVGSGLLAEGIFEVNRFDAQGHFWSGTAVAMFPVFVVLPALIMLPLQRRTERWLFWFTYFLIVFAAFYYQSRVGWLALVFFLVLGASRLGLRRLLMASALFVAFILYFPWDQAGPQPSGKIVRSIKENVQKSAPTTFVEKFRTMEGAMPSMQQRTPDTPEHDVDRIIAFKAAWCSAAQGSVVRFLFGTGYWTHRYELLDCIHRLAAESRYSFPTSYDVKVRTATFNGMLVDTGITGIVLLAALFMLTAWTIFRSSAGPRVMSIGSLALISASLVLSLNYDVMLLYLAVMPGGALLLLHRAGTPAAG